MRVALCLSGQPRFVRECYSGIKSHLIDLNKPDIFIHTWSYEKESDRSHKFGGNGGWKNHRIGANDHKYAVEMYDPVSHVIEDKRNFSIPKVDLRRGLSFYSPGTEKEAVEAEMSHDDYCRLILSNNLSMWYSIQSCHLLALNHAMSNNFEYDWIVRCRFDLDIKQGLKLSALDNKFLYAVEMSKKYGHIADWLNFSSSENMSIYASTFMAYRKLHSQIEESQTNPTCNEMVLAHNLARHGITCINLPIDIDVIRL